MNRATIFQAAVAAIVVGLFLLLAASVPAQPSPSPVTSFRPATELEEQKRERERLEEELDRVWRQQR